MWSIAHQLGRKVTNEEHSVSLLQLCQPLIAEKAHRHTWPCYENGLLPPVNNVPAFSTKLLQCAVSFRCQFVAAALYSSHLPALAADACIGALRPQRSSAAYAHAITMQLGLSSSP